MMHRSTITMAAFTAGALLLFLAGMTWAASAPATPKLPQGWKFTLPDGDANAGKTVFLNMKCYSCHAIEIPGEKLPPARSKGAGPAFTGYAVLPREYLAESIIKFHTVVAAPGYAVKEGRAAMGEYNHFLSVQEVIDLVAFLKQGTQGAGK
ncbi:MAG: c-type cytochrome [Candidatus Binatia bacterium]